MSNKQLPKYRLEQFEEMVRSRLAPLQSVVEAVEERLRIKVERQVAKETGLVRLEKEIQKLQRQLEDLEAQRNRVVKGGGKRSGYYPNEGSMYAYAPGSPFAKEVEARVSMANGVIGQWRELHRRSFEQVRLLHAPEAVAELLEKIGKEVSSLMPKLISEQKKLPAPSTSE